MKQKAALISLLCLSLSLISGCMALKNNTLEQSYKFTKESNYTAAANVFLDENGNPNYDKDELDKLLIAGKAFHDAGMWELSYQAFGLASDKLAWKTDEVDTGEEFARLIGTTLTNDLMADYTGRIYEGVMLDYYQTINQLMLSNENKLRVHINRNDVRQENAVVQFTSYKNALASSDIDTGKIDRQKFSRVRNKMNVGIEQGMTQIPRGDYRTVRNPMADILSAFLRQNSSSQVDKNSSKINFYTQNASQVINGYYGTESAFKPFESHFTQYEKPQVLVILEDGIGPTLEEHRVDLPLFLFTDKAYYSGVALPKFRTGIKAKSAMKLQFGKTLKPLTVATDLNHMASLEFESSYDQKVSKQIISAIIKTAAQVSLGKKLEEEDPLVATLGKLLTASTQAALTRADTRHWSNLPNTINSALLFNDGSGTLNFIHGNQRVHSVDIPKGKDVIIYARSSSINGPIQTYTQTIPLGNSIPRQFAKTQ